VKVASLPDMQKQIYDMSKGFDAMKAKDGAKRCPICGCTEHRLVGCGVHWARHRKNSEGRCEDKTRPAS